MTKQQCNDIMKTVYSAILPKIGTVKTLPLAYQYGPIKYQGLGFPNLYTLQGTELIKMMMMHGGQQTQIGDCIMCALEGHQIKCGLTTPLFELDFDKYGILVSDSIVKTLWAFTWKHGYCIVSNS